MIQRWIPFCCWKLRPHHSYVDLTPPDGGLSRHVQKADYSLRLQRYWWAANKLADEARLLDREMVVVDMGCERGWLKRFTDPKVSIRWIGLDGDISKPSLAATKYDELIQCDFNQPLPLPNDCADVVVSLHVFEHLPNPDSAASEVARVLRTGGVFLAGSPTMPAPLAPVRTVMLQARDKAGRNRHWGHVRSFSPATWFNVCIRAGLRLEFIVGSHFCRSTGSRLEGQRWWIRLNQLWSNVFPSLGTEAYVAARKPKSNVAPIGAVRRMTQRLWSQFDWAAPATAVAAIAIALLPLSSTASSFHDEVATHQDGNDVFYWCPVSKPEDERSRDGLKAIAQPDLVHSTFMRYAAVGRDLHIIASADLVHDYLNTDFGSRLRLADRWERDGKRYMVLSMEDHESPLSTQISGG